MAKSFQKVSKALPGNILHDDRFAQRDKNCVGWPAFITGIKFLLPPIEQFQSALCVRNLIAQVIRPTAVGVKIVEVLMEFFWQQPACDVKVFVVVGCEPARVLLRGFH